MNAEKTRSEDEGVASSLVEVGMMWARYGLTVGSGALNTSARSLEKTADALKMLSSQFELPAEEKVEKKAEDAESEIVKQD